MNLENFPHKSVDTKQEEQPSLAAMIEQDANRPWAMDVLNLENLQHFIDSGKTISIKRSSGEVEGGWQIESTSDNGITIQVSKIINGERHAKTLTLIEVMELNNPEIK